MSNECQVSQAWDPHSSDPQPLMVPFLAVWDTGATGSVITQKVIDACGLVATGKTKVTHVGGEEIVDTYLVNIGLPNHVVFYGERVTKGKLGDIDMLIGMNIINQGDFAVTNPNGLTKFTFRVPSTADIDFVQEDNAQVANRPQLQHGNRPKPKRSKGHNPANKGKKGRKAKSSRRHQSK